MISQLFDVGRYGVCVFVLDNDIIRLGYIIVFEVAFLDVCLVGFQWRVDV
jgi:hypothetical protein